MRQDGQIRDAAILFAVGVGLNGKRQILDVSVFLSEYEVHWRVFLQSLVECGLGSVQLITSDDHQGLKAARVSVFGGVPWQIALPLPLLSPLLAAWARMPSFIPAALAFQQLWQRIRTAYKTLSR